MAVEEGFAHREVVAPHIFLGIGALIGHVLTDEQRARIAAQLHNALQTEVGAHGLHGELQRDSIGRIRDDLHVPGLIGHLAVLSVDCVIEFAAPARVGKHFKPAAHHVIPESTLRVRL